MIQARQFRKTHEDTHYAAAVFPYQCEMAVEFKEFSNFLCLDGKHRIKIGKPNFPVTAENMEDAYWCVEAVHLKLVIIILLFSVSFHPCVF